MPISAAPLITNDAVVLGLLASILGFVFYTSGLKTGFWPRLYAYVPPLLLCYFIPSVFNSTGVISGDQSALYTVVINYLLPVCLIFFTLSVDFKAIAGLGKRAVIIFFAAVAGVMAGGPVAILVVSAFSPETVAGQGPDAIWRGLSTIAGSWIGGGANQTAMKEIFKVSDDLFAAMVAVDIIIANLWMALLLFCVQKAGKIDRALKADNSRITELQQRIEQYEQSIIKMPEVHHYIIMLAVGFGFMGLSQWLAGWVVPFIQTNFPQLERFSLTSTFFWVILIATTIGIILSFTKARRLEAYGTFKLGNVIIYFMVATIGMKMDVTAIFSNPGLFMVGLVWILVHIVVVLVVARLIRAPFFFTAVGSQACIGGPVSAPIVAAAFHPSLAPVGVLLAVLGYAIGTYGAYLTALLMQAVSP